jgi:hypothetical protein
MNDICTAILKAYNVQSLTMTVQYLMDEQLANIVPPGDFTWQVFNLVQWADMNGREVELVQALGKSRPKHALMQQIYNKYGLSVPVSVQSAGANRPNAPATVADGGLEQIVRPHLSFNDFGIWQERMTQVGGRVCMITISGAPQGTGFLVGPDAVLTNYHVMESVLAGRRQPTEVECVFDFKRAADGTTTRTPVRLHTDWQIDNSEYAPKEMTPSTEGDDPTTEQLDYALIRLAESIGGRPWSQKTDPTGAAPDKMVGRGWFQLPNAGAPSPFKSPMGVLIAQHPSGFPLKLALDTDGINQQTGRWLNAAGTRVRYATNTLGGSSGSPVCDMEWNLIALHHYGDSVYSHSTTKSNQGVPIQLIRDRLAKRGHANALGGDPPS